MEFKKAQVSMEFFMLVGLAFLASVIMVGISASEIKDFSYKKEYTLIQDMGLRLEKEVNIGSYVEDGYERTFDIPEKLENSVGYTISTTNRSITINASKSVFSVGVPFIKGNFRKGSNKIEKIDGKVYVNQ